MDINIKIDAAKNAFESWKHSPIQARKRVVRSLLSWIVKERGAYDPVLGWMDFDDNAIVEMLARVCCRDTGKTSEFFPWM